MSPRLVRVAIFLATAIFVSMMFVPLVQDLLSRLLVPPDAGLP